MDAQRVEQLKVLFQSTWKAHHAAFIEADGADPEWPIWYAEHLHGELSERLGARFTKSELIYLLVLVDKEQRLHAPGSEWATYYARFFLERYA